MSAPMQLASAAAKRLGITRNALQKRLDAGTVTGAVRKYVWEGKWLRLMWHIPRSYR